MKEVVLYSGGMDSHIAWYYLGKPEAIYIVHGCRYEWKQLRAIQKIREIEGTNKISIVDGILNLSPFELPDANIPLRNMYFAMVAANLGYDKIYLIVQRGETSIPDRTPKFFKQISQILTEQFNREIVVESPFFDMTKQDMVKWYLDNGGNIESLLHTTACFHPVYDACGNCKACFRRWVALRYNGLEDKYRNYHQDIRNSPVTKKYIEDILNGKYDEKRSQQTLEVLRKEGLL